MSTVAAEVADLGRSRVALFGLFGVTNIGNEASLASALRFLARERPDVDVVVVCARPDVVAAQHAVSAVPMSMAGRMPSFSHAPRIVRLAVRPVLEIARWWSAYRFVKSVDAVVVPGTGILDDFGEDPSGMPYDLFRWCAVARLAGHRMSMLSVGAGPIDRPLNRWLMSRAVQFAGVMSYRDEVSRAFMAGLGAGTPADAVRPDVAFALERPAEHVSRADGPLRVGLGLMAYYGWTNAPNLGADTFDSYIESMSAIADRLLADGCCLRLLVGESSDRVAVDRLLVSLRRRGQEFSATSVVAEPIRDFDDLLHEIAQCDVVVGTRFHNVVAALMMSRPTVSIGYAEKNREVMTNFGLGQYCHHVDDMRPESVVEDVRKVAALSKELSPRLHETNERYIRAVEAQFGDVFAGAQLSIPTGTTGT